MNKCNFLKQNLKKNKTETNNSFLKGFFPQIKLFNLKKEAWNNYFFEDKTFPEVDLELTISLNIEIKHKIKTWHKCKFKYDLKL